MHEALELQNYKKPPDRVRKAIATGIFKGGGKKFPCENEVKEATTIMLIK